MSQHKLHYVLNNQFNFNIRSTKLFGRMIRKTHLHWGVTYTHTYSYLQQGMLSDRQTYTRHAVGCQDSFEIQWAAAAFTTWTYTVTLLCIRLTSNSDSDADRISQKICVMWLSSGVAAHIGGGSYCSAGFTAASSITKVWTSTGRWIRVTTVWHLCVTETLHLNVNWSYGFASLCILYAQVVFDNFYQPWSSCIKNISCSFTRKKETALSMKIEEFC